MKILERGVNSIKINLKIIKSSKYNKMLWNPSKSITFVEKNKQVENRWFKDIPCESDSFDKII